MAGVSLKAGEVTVEIYPPQPGGVHRDRQRGRWFGYWCCGCEYATRCNRPSRAPWMNTPSRCSRTRQTEAELRGPAAAAAPLRPRADVASVEGTECGGRRACPASTYSPSPVRHRAGESQSAEAVHLDVSTTGLPAGFHVTSRSIRQDFNTSLLRGGVERPGWGEQMRIVERTRRLVVIMLTAPVTRRPDWRIRNTLRREHRLRFRPTFWRRALRAARADQRAPPDALHRGRWRFAFHCRSLAPPDAGGLRGELARAPKNAPALADPRQGPRIRSETFSRFGS